MLIENLHPNYQAEFPVGRQVRYVDSINHRTGRLESLESIRENAEILLINFSQSHYLATYELELIFRDTHADVRI